MTADAGHSSFDTWVTGDHRLAAAVIARRHAQPSALIALLLYVEEVSLLLGVLALYKKDSRPLVPFLATPVGLVLVLALATFAATTFALLRLIHRNPQRARSFWPTLA